jgi:RNA polymerase sigma-70 factor (ECF subfamily)
MMRDDDQLMIDIQGGDATAFPVLVERYQHALVGFFFRNTRDIQLAEDLSQETLLKVFNQSWDYLPLGRFRAWMYRIARNLLIDDVRRRSNDALIRAVRGRRDDEDDALAQLAGDFIGPTEQAQQGELAGLVREFLGEIPDDQRQTFTLHHDAGLSLPEVAEIMEIPLATCKSRLRLAREKLAEKLRNCGIQPVKEMA